MTEVKRRGIKNFGRYFWNTFKEAKYLLFKYVVCAVLMSVITVLANLLQVQELTYLNAVLAINAFSTSISFGISQGITVMVNQSINSKFRVRKYIRLGNIINLIFVTIFTMILALFPRFIMETITSYVPQDYTFYYLMCGYFFICGIKEYLLQTLKQLKIFKMQFFSDCLNYILVVLGFIILYFSGFYLLNYIASIYIVAVFITMIIGIIVITKNKTVSVNLFHFEKISLTKKQIKIILYNLGAEFIWQIGIFLISVFFLRLSDALLNTFSYLEVVLDILLGFYLAFADVTSIKIARALGRSNFDKASLYAKYSIYGTFVIWLFYFAVSMIFSYPIALGVNKEYFLIMFSVLPCYAFVYLLKFTNWTFSSYMLRLGGKAFSLFVIESIKTLLYLVLCLISRYIPNNVYLAYLIISIPEIMAIPIEFIIYKRKKWLANVNEDPNLLRNKVKCFIFDFDDTLYYGVNSNAFKQLVLNFFNEHFSQYSEKEKKQILKKYHCGRKGLEVYRHIKEILIDYEGSSNAWINFKGGLELQPEEKQGKGILNKELEKCKQLGHLYIVSNSHIKEIQMRAKLYGINLKLFKKIYSNDTNIADGPKGVFYKQIMESEKLLPENMLVVGDQYKTDLLPAKELEMNIFKSDGGFTFEELVG